MVARTQQTSVHERRSLRGDLEHVSLPSLLSFLAHEQKTGVLLMIADTSASASTCAAGSRCASRSTSAPSLAPTIRRRQALLDWTRGQFEFAAQDVACADDLGTTVMALLLEHARRSDERAR